MPPSNAYLSSNTAAETPFPLHVYVCRNCLLVQLEQFQTPEEIFGHYSYFSSYSPSWLEHGKTYTEQMVRRFSLNPSHFVVEIASNDGYLLQHFHQKKIPHLGIEPAKNVAEVAMQRGISTWNRFFGKTVAQELAQSRKADLLIANNVIAQVPDLNDFLTALQIALAPNGILTIECQHLAKIFEENQFDTIYHEHFSYFSLFTLNRALQRHRLEIFDVDLLSTHGGSIRLYVQHCGGKQKHSPSLQQLLNQEITFGWDQLSTYHLFFPKVQKLKEELLQFFSQAKKENKQIAAYGAAAKGNTLLNFCGITAHEIPFVVDRNPHKHGLFLPGSRIPIHPPEKVMESKPDYLLILPWNWKREIETQMGSIRSWGGRFVIPIPQLLIQ